MTAPRKAVFLVGYYGAGNLGDELLLWTLTTALRDRYGTDVDILATAFKGRTVDFPPDVEPVDLLNAYAVADAVGRASVVAFGGGGLFHDKARVGFWEMFDSPCWSNAMYLRPLLLADWYEKPVLMLGNGFGPIRTDEGRRLGRKVAAMCGPMTLRDRQSHEALVSCGVAPDRAEVHADLAWGMNLARLPRAPLALPPRRIVVNLRATMVDVPEALPAEVAAALGRARAELGLRPVFVPFQYEGRYGDARAMADLAGRLPGLSTIAEPARILENVEALRGATVSLGMRLHAAIVATKLGVPHVAIAYDPKVEAAMADAGAEDRCFDLSVGADALFEAIRRATELDREAVSRRADQLAGRSAATLRLLYEAIDAARAAASEVPEVAGAKASKLAGAFERYGHRLPIDMLPGVEGELVRTRRQLAALRARPPLVKRLAKLIRRRLSGR